MAQRRPSERLFKERLEESVRRYGVSGAAKRFGVNRSTIYRWRTDRPNQSVKPQAKSARKVVRQTLTDRRMRMYEGLVSRRRDILTEAVANAPTAAARRAAQARLDGFEEEVEEGTFQTAFKQMLRQAKSREDWKDVRTSYKSLVRAR